MSKKLIKQMIRNIYMLLSLVMAFSSFNVYASDSSHDTEEGPRST